MVNGVKCSGSLGWVCSNEITYPRDHGIVIENGSTVTCAFNTLSKTDQSGAGILFGSGSGNYVLHNQISGFEWGVGAIWAGFPCFGFPYSNEYAEVNNLIHNCIFGLRVYEESSVSMEDEDPEYLLYSHSSIKNNTFRNIDVRSDSYVPAALNFWDDTSAAKYNNYPGGWYNIIPSLDVDPWPDMNFAAQVPPSATKPGGMKVLRAPLSIAKQVADDFTKGMQLRSKREFVKAFEAFKKSITEDKKVTQSLLAINSLYNDTLSLQIDDLFSSLPTEKYPLAVYLQGIRQIQRNNTSAALAGMNRLPSNSSFLKASKLSLFYGYLYGAKDRTKAQEMLNDLSKNSDGFAFELALAKHDFESYAFNTTKMSAQKLQNGMKKSVSIGKSIPAFSLDQNSPNPFNPTTMISFEIPEACLVSLIVYDYIGREVQTLINDYRASGRYTVSCNASNLASGVYFYRLTASTSTSIKKMLLIK